MAPSKPKFATKPHMKPKGTRSRGIVREMPDKVIPRNDISSESESQTIEKGPKGKSVQKRVVISDSAPSSVKMTAKVKDCIKVIFTDFEIQTMKFSNKLTIYIQN